MSLTPEQDLLQYPPQSPSHGLIYHVDAHVSISGDGLSWQTAFRTIQEAVNVANDNNEVWIKNAYYEECVVVEKRITLYGGFSGFEIERDERVWENMETRIDGHGNGSTVTLYLGRIDGIYITGGSARHGGGLYLGGDAVAYNCIISNNVAYEYGGGVYLQDYASIKGCTISGNTSSMDAGGGYLHDYAEMLNCIISNNFTKGGGGGLVVAKLASAIGCIISSNTAIEGGGVFLENHGFIQDSTITDNVSEQLGGGISAYDDVIIAECLLLRNTSDGSGGGAALHRNVLMHGCEVDGNSATQCGGGVYLEHCASLVNNILSHNVGGFGGGIYPESMDSANAMLSVVNCTLALNTTSTLEACAIYCPAMLNMIVLNTIVWNEGESFSGPGVDNLIAAYCIIKGGFMGEGNIDQDPLFANLENGDLYPKPESPCFNSGVKTYTIGKVHVYAPPIDILGVERSKETIDIGAYEHLTLDLGDLSTLISDEKTLFQSPLTDLL